jgi:hypothetical protein
MVEVVARKIAPMSNVMTLCAIVRSKPQALQQAKAERTAERLKMLQNLCLT